MNLNHQQLLLQISHSRHVVRLHLPRNSFLRVYVLEGFLLSCLGTLLELLGMGGREEDSGGLLGMEGGEEDSRD